VCVAGNAASPGPIGFASMSLAAWHQPLAGSGRRQAAAEKIQALIRSATSTSILPKYVPKQAGSTCSSPLTAPASLPLAGWSSGQNSSTSTSLCLCRTGALVHHMMPHWAVSDAYGRDQVVTPEHCAWHDPQGDLCGRLPTASQSQARPVCVGLGAPRSWRDTTLYSSTGEGEAAMICRHVWHKRWCGPSEQNSRSQRRQFRRFSFLALREGLI
jgi:hypothetical protein